MLAGQLGKEENAMIYLITATLGLALCAFIGWHFKRSERHNPQDMASDQYLVTTITDRNNSIRLGGYYNE